MPGRLPRSMRKPSEDVNVPRADLRDATIVFDLDGTLVDTAPDLTNALERRAHPPRPRRDFARDHPRPRSGSAPG